MASFRSPKILPANTNWGTAVGSNNGSHSSSGSAYNGYVSWYVGWIWTTTYTGWKWTLTPISGYRPCLVMGTVKRTRKEYEEGELKSTTTSYIDCVYGTTETGSNAVTVPISDFGEEVYTEIGGLANGTKKTWDALRNPEDLKFYPIDEGTYTEDTYEVVESSLCALFCAVGKIYVAAVGSPSDAINYFKINGNTIDWAVVDPGSTVRLLADVYVSKGWGFYQWSGKDFSSSSNGCSDTPTEDKVYTCTCKKRTIHITVQKSPDSATDVTPFGSGDYYEGESVVIGVTGVLPYFSGWKFDHWNDNVGGNNRRITVTAEATYTAYVVRVTEIYLGCYATSLASFFCRCPWSATASCDGSTISWGGQDTATYTKSATLNVPAGESATLTAPTPSPPAYMELTWKGWYKQNGALVSTSQSFSTNEAGTYAAVYDIKVKCELLYNDPDGFDYYDDQQITDLSSMPAPELTLGTAESVSLTTGSSSYTFDLLWDLIALYQDNYPTIPTGLTNRTDLKIKISSVKTAENDVTKGALDVYCDGISVSGEGRYQFGLRDYSEYQSTGVVFGDAYSIMDMVGCFSGVTDSRVQIKMNYSTGMIADMRVSVSDGLVLANAALSGLVVSYHHNVGDIELCMLSSWILNGAYRLRIPISGMWMSYFEAFYSGRTANESLSLKAIKVGTSSIASDRARRGSDGDWGLVRSDLNSLGLTLSDSLDVRIHVGTYKILKNGGGRILSGSSGAPLEDW